METDCVPMFELRMEYFTYIPYYKFKYDEDVNLYRRNSGMSKPEHIINK